jgi:serine/threonine-protein kinase RsbW
MDMRTYSPWTAVQLDLSSRLEVLEEVQSALGRVTDAAGVDPDVAVNVGVAVRESVVNAIKHGNEMDEDKQVHVSLVVDDDALEIVVRDEGAGFDPDSVPDPFAEENLLKPDGRGMLMMKTFMDEVTFTFPVCGGTVVRMRKRLN